MGDVRALWKKILLAFFAVLIAAVPLFMLRPARADALAGMALCLQSKAKAEAEAVATAATASALAIFAIPTSDIGLKIMAQRQLAAASEQSTLKLKDCILKPLTRIIAKTLLHTMTKSVVNWINSGFRGSPSFVTNPEGFITDVADQTIGRVIEDIAPVLCKPFRFNLQLALGLNFSARFKEEVRCRLSDVVANVQGFYDSFVGGQFSAGGWQSWINIAGVPQNNAYGAYLTAQGGIHASIVSETGKELKLLDWGKGFQSWRVCKRYEEVWTPEAEAKGKPGKGKCLEYGPIKTPGALIVDQAGTALGGTLRELEVAQELDEIFAALVNQLLVRAFGGGSSGGFAGVSRPDSSGVVYINTIPTSLDENPQFSTLQKPNTDIDCARNYTAGGTDTGITREATPIIEDMNRLVAIGQKPDAKPEQITAGLRAQQDLTFIRNGGGENNILLVEAKDAATGFPTGLNEIARSNANNRMDNSIPPKPIPYSGNPILKPTSNTWKEYMTALSVACSREANDALITKGDAVAGSQLGRAGEGTTVTAPPPSPPPPPQTFEGNISLGKETAQSSTMPGNDVVKFSARAENAVDGDKDYRFSSTNANKGKQWWMIDLKTNRGGPQEEFSEIQISKIRIYTPFDGAFRDGNYKFNQINYKVYVTPTALGNPSNPGGEATLLGSSSFILSDGNITFKYNSATDTSARNDRYIYIVSINDEVYLPLAEVEVFGKATKISSVPGGPAPELPLLLTAKPAQGIITLSAGALGLRNPRRGEKISQTVTFAAQNKDAAGVRFEAQLFKEITDANGVKSWQKEVWSVGAFEEFSITRKSTPAATTQFITINNCPNAIERCMNIEALKNIDLINENAAAQGDKIIFAEEIVIPKDGSVDFELAGKISQAVVSGANYRIVITATKPKTAAETQDAKAESKNEFTIAP